VRGYGERRGRGIKRLLIISLLPIILIVISYVIYKVFLIPPPMLKGTDEFKFLSAEKTIVLEGENIRDIEINIRQGSRVITILKDRPSRAEVSYKLNIKPEELGLHDGRAKTEIKAKSGVIKKIQLSVETIVDTVPPEVSIVSSPQAVKPGQAASSRFRVKGAESVYLQFGDFRFKAIPYPSRKKADIARAHNKDEYIIIFPVPYSLPKDTVFYVVAEDRAGNRTIKALATKVKSQRFRSSRITISDEFLKRVVYPLLDKNDSDTPVKDFVTVNEKWRERDVGRLYEIGQRSVPKRLWDGRFIQMRNSKVMARFGDLRTYYYNGRAVSRSVHLGYDLASTAQAPVEASNSGVVVYAGDMGIYGNTIIIDHGLGVMSLYGHLSQILVDKGQKVKKGEIIGRTGSTGFAGGDHLHFGILVQGIEVSPLYWWDQQWVRNHILDVIEGGV
jgi:murein DD-endopeptidase MepM/ murein hydrolase activator NlpD